SPTTSSASPRRRSTISPAARLTRSRSRRCSDFDFEICRERSALRRRPMAIEGSRSEKAEGPIRLGMVGGGQGGFIGAVHRIAARIDGEFQLVAGALSSDPERAKASAAELGLDPDRSYGSFQEMAKAEAKRPDGIEAVAIVTPNHMHFPPAKAFLEAGIHVICDKPLTSTLADAKKLAALVEKTRKGFVLTHNYTGYPKIPQARAI